MPRGGRRPGAGATRGNMNALKHGGYSRQFAHVGALLASNSKIREALLAIAARHNLRQAKPMKSPPFSSPACFSVPKKSPAAPID